MNFRDFKGLALWKSVPMGAPVLVTGALEGACQMAGLALTKRAAAESCFQVPPSDRRHFIRHRVLLRQEPVHRCLEVLLIQLQTRGSKRSFEAFEQS